MNEQIVNQTQSNVNVQTKVIGGAPWAFGFQDGANNVTVYTGYHLFTGSKLAQYKAGWREGQRVYLLRSN
jgi:hypothetical protein